MSTISAPLPELTCAEILARYDIVLLDSYGVLVDEDGALPGAPQFLAQLHAAKRRFMVVSNDASRLPESSIARYRERGLPIASEQLLTSGDLLQPYFREHQLQGARCIVLGPSDSQALVTEAGGTLVPYTDPTPDAVVVCDDDGYPFVEAIESVIGTLYARIAGQHPLHLILPNPDLLYPRSPGRFGLTAGSVARLIEGALALRFPDDAPTFVGLGKPHAPMFEHALARLGASPKDRVLMVGDQLATDIAGARALGLDAALIATGVSDPHRLPTSGPRPTAWIRSLES